MALDEPECIVLEESTFYAARGSVDAQLVAKIEAMLAGYSCFTEQALAPSFPPARAHPCKRYDHFRKKVSAGGARPPHHIPRRVQPERQLTALLNKISKSNFEKIAHLIQELPLSSEFLVGSILNKCQKQPGFMSLYVRLLRILHENYGVDKQQEIQRRVGTFIEQCIDQCAQDMTFTLDHEDYDEFCNNITFKADALGRHKTLLALLFLNETGMIEHSVIKAQRYFDALFQRAKAIGEKEKRNNDLHELVLEMVLDCSRCGREDWSAQLRAYFTNPLHTSAYSAKARFKVMDIFE